MKSFFEYHNLTEETEPALHESDSVSVRLGSNNYTLELAETPDKIYKGNPGAFKLREFEQAASAIPIRII